MDASTSSRRHDTARSFSGDNHADKTMNPQTTIVKRSRRVHPPAANQEFLLRQGILKLLDIKDSDIRLLTLGQCRDAIDKSLHAGGAFSATIPLVALYYGG